MSLDGILGEDKPAAPPEKKITEKPAEAAPAAAEKASTDPVERQQSKRKEWQAKEQDAQGRVRDPVTGQFVPKTEPAAAPEKKEAAPAKDEPKKEEPAKPAAAAPAAPQQEFTEKEKAFLRAAQEERQKRQALEQQLAALRGGQAQPAAPTEAKKTFWDDPEGALAKHTQTVQETVVNARLNVAETIARSQHPDFDEKAAVFREILTNAGPNAAVIAQQWLASPDPAMFAYNMGKNHLELRQVGNLDAMREKIVKETEARVRAEVEAQFKAKQEELETQRAALPPSLSDVRSTGANRRVWGGPTALDDILKS